jgi:hypothetical protein
MVKYEVFEVQNIYIRRGSGASGALSQPKSLLMVRKISIFAYRFLTQRLDFR